MMNIPNNELGFATTEDLINWTTSYLHFKQALEVLELTPEITQHYFKQFGEYRERLAKDLSKQGFLEARLPKEMREKIAQEKPYLAFIKQALEKDS